VPEAPAAEKPAEKADAADESLPIGETLNILDETKDFEETLQSLNTGVSDSANLLHQQQTRPVKMPPSMMKTGPLTGTPLVRTPLRTSPQPSKNRVQETVSSQWYVGKYEPPAQNLPNGTSMRPIDNPVADAVNAFRAAWRMPEAREQLMDFMLSLDGLRSKLEPRICKDRNITALQRVLRDRLQDLEAERLTALCQLDKARRDMDGFKQEIIAGMANRLQKETGKLESDRDACEAQVASLKTELNSLTVQRDSLLKHIDTLQNDALPATISKLLGDLQLNIPLTGQPLRMSPVSGQQATLDELLARLTAVCGKCGLTLTKNQGIALLLLLAMSDRIGIVSPTPAPAATLIRNIAAAMGWERSFAHQISAEQRPMVALRPVDATPVLLLTSLPNYAPISGMHKLLLSRSSIGLTRNAAYDAGQWPILPLPALPFIPELLADDAAPISQAALTALLDATSVAKTSDEEITAVLSPIFAMVPPLSGAARAEMYRFIRVAAALMEGGLPVALDFAILLWVVPMVDRTSRNFADFKALLDEYPLSQAKL
ncbi:MAG: keratin, partial [Faecalibacterium sp.]|nr:keratin [Faecalibacterium sp.]